MAVAISTGGIGKAGPVKPDPLLAADQLAALQNNFKIYGLDWFCAQNIWILKKKPEPEDPQPKGHWNRRLVPFVFNDIQQDYYNNRDVNNIILKGRQFGFTTWGIICELLIAAILEPGSAGLLISQTGGYGAQHFGILQRAHKYFAKVVPFDDTHPRNLLWHQLHQHLLHTQYSHRKEIVYDMLDSRVLVGSAEVTEVGQGLPGISYLWCSEVSRWPHNPEETMANVTESVHSDGRKTIECTANGMDGNYFYEEVKRAKAGDSVYKYHFYEWFKHKEYRRKNNVVPFKALTDEEKEIKERYDLDMEQMTWRRIKVKALRHEFKEKYPENDLECFLSSGMPFFDNQILIKRKTQLETLKPFMKSDDGTMIFFRRRVKGRRYVIAMDPARGILINNTDTDRAAAVCIDEETGEEMAAFADRLPPEEFALAGLEMAKTYNDAMIAVERTGDGTTVMLQLEHNSYHNIYRHREWLREEQQVIELPGWPATTITRPIACNRLALIVREYPEHINDIEAISEFFSFQRGKDGRPAASPGNHDDRVSCRYIAQYVRLVNLGYLDPILMRKERYGSSAESEAA